MDKDSAGNIYVSNKRHHKILKFNSSGAFIDYLGKKGQGPGELEKPQEIIVTDEFLLVKEFKRIQFLDHQGNYIRSLRTKKTYGDISLGNQGHIFACPFVREPNAKLLDELSSTGEILLSFGKPLDFGGDLGPLNDCHIAVDENFIYIAFLFFPIVRKYSYDAELLGEYRFDHDEMSRKEQMNRNAYNMRKKGQRTGYVQRSGGDHGDSGAQFGFHRLSGGFENPRHRARGRGPCIGHRYRLRRQLLRG